MKKGPPIKEGLQAYLYATIQRFYLPSGTFLGAFGMFLKIHVVPQN
jgi:hypothetical protein